MLLTPLPCHSLTLICCSTYASTAGQPPVLNVQIRDESKFRQHGIKYLHFDMPEGYGNGVRWTKRTDFGIRIAARDGIPMLTGVSARAKTWQHRSNVGHCKPTVIWSPDSVESQAGKLFVVTGANAGIGLETAALLAGKGAHVILACRNPDKGAHAAARIRLTQGDALVTSMTLDLASLSSVRDFARRLSNEHGHLDGLINNAGVMTPPLGRTADNLETQFGTNFIGHFLLTLLTLPMLGRRLGARVVTLSSVAHWSGRIDFDNLNAEKSYSKWGAYAQSKLANLLFMYELQRRLDASGSTTISTGAHPGITASDLTRHNLFLRVTQKVLAQTTVKGAMPSLRAATDRGVRGGDYFGPGSALTLTLYGDARKQRSSSLSRNKIIAARLWRTAEDISNERWSA